MKIFKKKLCSICNSSFDPSSGSQKYCGESCATFGFKKWQNENKEYLKSQRLIYEDKNRERINTHIINRYHTDDKYKQSKNKSKKRYNASILGKYSRFKSDAIARNIRVGLDISQYETVIVQNCKYCGTSKNIGVDRLDSQSDYVINNVAPCCYRCNISKHVMSTDEFKNFIETVYNFFVKKELI